MLIKVSLGLTIAFGFDWSRLLPEWLKRPWFTFLDEYMEFEYTGTYLILILIVLGLTGFWLWWDSYDFFDFLGALALLVAYLLISPLILLAYIGAKAMAFAGTWLSTRVPVTEERWFKRWATQAMRHKRLLTRGLTAKDREVIMHLRIDDQLSPEEIDPRVEELVSSGRKDEAIKYVKDVLLVARSMNDKRAIKRYEKYLLILRLGARNLQA